MKRILLLPLLLLSLSLAGCGAAENLGKLVKAATTTIANPVGQVDIYRVKNVYAAALEIAVKYRQFCWAKPYAEIMADPVARPVCRNRRQIVAALHSADRKAFAAITAAENFVRNNPTLNASAAINAAWAAVTDFQNLANRTAAVAR